MEETCCEVTDNISEVIDNVVTNGSDESTAALPITLSISADSYFRWSKTDLALGLVIPIVPLLVNSVVLVILVIAHREYGSAANAFIVNHSAANFLIFLSAIIVRLVRIGGIDKGYFGDQLIEDIICIFLIAQVVASLGGAAQNMALVIITLERYFKIVHAIAHRKHYKAWMTKVGVALPWIFGVCFAAIPVSATTRRVDGLCRIAGVWPNKDLAKVNTSTK